MKNRSITYLLLFGICSMLAIMQSCQKTDDLEADINSLKDRVAALEKAMKENNTEVISPSMCYAYAAIAEGAPFIMGAPNLCVDTPAMWEFSKQKNVPISGKDFKSGQTLMKTVLAPMFKTRMLGVNGWFSTNILGNRDGEVLDDPDNFKTKEVSKLSVIDTIFEPEKFPDLYLMASGGVSNVDDIIALNEAGVPGVIFGKALYEGHLTLQDLRIFLD